MRLVWACCKACCFATLHADRRLAFCWTTRSMFPFPQYDHTTSEHAPEAKQINEPSINVKLPNLAVLQSMIDAEVDPSPKPRAMTVSDIEELSGWCAQSLNSACRPVEIHGNTAHKLHPFHGNGATQPKWYLDAAWSTRLMLRVCGSIVSCTVVHLERLPWGLLGLSSNLSCPKQKNQTRILGLHRCNATESEAKAKAKAKGG